MRNIRAAVLAGIAALCVAGTAVAATNHTHILNVDLPDGSIARIEYQGDVAPKVRIDPTIGLIPVRFIDAPDAAPVALFDRIFADMDRQAAALLQQAQALSRQPLASGARPDLAAFGGMPAGTVSYSFVSTSDGTHSCSRSWQVTSQGAGQQPKLVSASSGDCGAAGPAKAAPTTAPAEATPPAHPVASAGTI